MAIWGPLVLALVGSCNKDGTAPPRDQQDLQAKERAVILKAAVPADVMGFEIPGAWSTSTVGAILGQSSTHSQGSFSLSVRPSARNGYTPIASVPLTTVSGVSTVLAVDMMLPTQQANPYWLGAAQMYLNCPSRGIYSQFLAQVELTGKPLAVWNTLSFPLTNTQVSGLLNAGYSDLTITVVLNVAVPTSGTYFIDNLRFVPVAANACRGKPNGTACTDGNACTQGDTCQWGFCRPGAPTVCPSPDQCHAAPSCNPATGLCSNPPKPDGTSCDDGNLCTQTDACQGGSCVGEDPTACTALDQCHVAGVCDGATGVCSNPTKDDGSACDDGDACTQTDSCQTGACVGGNPTVCTALDQCHLVGTCDPATGVCSDPAKADGSACDDGDACTETDGCQTGACVGGNPKVCTALDQCHVVGTCDPGTGVCSNPVMPDGSVCNDGNACTLIDICQSGACVGAKAKVCTALDQCHVVGVCDPATGVCSNPPSADGTPCDDGNGCTQTDSCVSGSCSGGNLKVCMALDQCHAVGVCDPASGACSNPTLPDGSPCSDGDACTRPDTCVQGGCVGAVVTCARMDACHAAGACDPVTGQCSNPEISCDDQDPCTTDGCDPNACEPEQCGDQNGCGHVLTYGPACPEPAPAIEVTITNAVISAETAAMRPGETIPLTYALQASAEQTDFSVEFVLFPMEISSTDEEVEGVSLGGTRLATVPAGSSEHTIWLEVPEEAPGGSYQLYAHKYSDGEGDFWQGSEVYTIEPAPVFPSFDLSGYEPDSVSLFIDQESTVDPNNLAQYRPLDHSGTLELLSRNQDATFVPVRAYLYAPDAPNTLLPLHIWDFQSRAYVSTLLVNDLMADQPQTLLLDLALSEPVAEGLRALVPPQTPVSTQILITVNETSALPEAECAGTPEESCRHQITVPATLFLPPPDPNAPPVSMNALGMQTLDATSSTPLQYQYSWQKSSGNQYFRAGIQFNAEAQLAADGLSTLVEGKIPVSVLSLGVDVLRARFAIAAPLDTPATASGYISFVCTSVGCLETPFSFSAVGEYSYTYSRPIVHASTQIVVVVVPVTLQMGIDAGVTFVASIGATSTTDLAALTLTPSLTASVDGWVSGGVGVPGMSGGAQGTVTLLGATLAAPISGECLVARYANGNVVTGRMSERMTVSGQMLNGTVGLYVEYPTLKWCKKWGIKYPCGIRINRATKNICSWPGIQLGPWTVYDKQQDAFTIDNCNPTTCTAGMCGSMDNGCGGTVDCGGCDGEHTCVGNTCQCTATCESLGWSCGTGTTACTSVLNCGACPTGQLCSNHVCVPDSGTGGTGGAGGAGGTGGTGGAGGAGGAGGTADAGVQDCMGVWGGQAYLDTCGVCIDRAGTPSAVIWADGTDRDRSNGCIDLSLDSPRLVEELRFSVVGHVWSGYYASTWIYLKDASGEIVDELQQVVEASDVGNASRSYYPPLLVSSYSFCAWWNPATLTNIELWGHSNACPNSELPP